MKNSFIGGKLVQKFSMGLFNRYILVGVWNTFFGYSVFALLTWFFTGIVPYDYMVAAVLGQVFSISASFLSYKIFVFKTRGNYINEYLRCWVVYGVSSLAGLIMLPIVVNLFRFLLPIEKHGMAPYLGGAVILMITVVVSFTGHRKYTFKDES